MVLPLVGIAALRASAKKRHQAAVAKVSRLKARGIDVAGTEFDPRKSWDVVKRYNTAQLNAYTKRLDEFVSRRNRFVGLKDRSPVTLPRWNRFLTSQERLNDVRNTVLDKIKDIQPPGMRDTIGSRVEDRNNRKVKGGDDQGQFVKKDYRPENIASTDALEKLDESMKRRASEDYQNTSTTSKLQSVYEMCVQVGDMNLWSMVSSLSKNQFAALLETQFMDLLSEIYSSVKEPDSRRDKEKVVSDGLRECYDLVRWASSLEV